MAAEVSKLLNDLSAYIKFVKSKAAFFDDLMQKLLKYVAVVREQIEVYLASQKAILPQTILRDFPDLKARVLSNLSGLIDEELCEISRYGYAFLDLYCNNQLCQLSDELKKMYEKIEKWMSQINWKEYLQYFNAISRISEWAEKCWKYFYFMYLNVQNGLNSLSAGGINYKCLRFIDTVDGISRRYIFENPVTDMFQMLKVDFSSRSRITVSSATVS